ncbi:MAG TPA: hypothetical protein VEA59_00875 [Patescibacteria group bacterium]|nr:hypothetical protein [Patescibacteria group bacterium]
MSKAAISQVFFSCAPIQKNPTFQARRARMNLAMIYSVRSRQVKAHYRCERFPRCGYVLIKADGLEHMPFWVNIDSDGLTPTQRRTLSKEPNTMDYEGKECPCCSTLTDEAILQRARQAVAASLSQEE